MKKIITVIVFILAIQLVYSSPFTNTSNDGLGDGILIKEIHVTKFPYGRNGKRFDKKNNPDLYFRLFENNHKISKSNVLKDCQRGRIHIFSGGKMPFRIEKNHTYYLQLLDFDSDKGVGSNKDEEVSSKILISYNNLISKGRRRSYLINDPRHNDVTFILIVEFVDSSVAAGKSAFIKNVKSMNQEKLAPRHRVYEGCGPIAGAMIMGYWQTEMGYNIMNPLDHFNGTEHPTKTILEFRKKADTKAWLNSSQAGTRKLKMVDALKHFVKKANLHVVHKPKLKVDIMWSIRRWAVTKAKLKKELREQSPVILLLKREPPCLTGKWVNSNKIGGDHYVVAVGFNDEKKEYYIMPGWDERNKSENSGPNVYTRENPAFCKCSYREIANSNPSLIWIKR